MYLIDNNSEAGDISQRALSLSDLFEDDLAKIEKAELSPKRKVLVRPRRRLGTKLAIRPKTTTTTTSSTTTAEPLEEQDEGEEDAREEEAQTEAPVKPKTKQSKILQSKESISEANAKMGSKKKPAPSASTNKKTSDRR